MHFFELFKAGYDGSGVSKQVHFKLLGNANSTHSQVPYVPYLKTLVYLNLIWKATGPAGSAAGTHQGWFQIEANG